MSFFANDPGQYNLINYNKIRDNEEFPENADYYNTGILGGHIVERMFKPSILNADHRMFKDGGTTDVYGRILRAGNIPPEARWFFIESIRVDRDRFKNSGHEDITVSPIDFVLQFMSSGLSQGMSGPRVMHFTGNEEFTTNVNGKELKRTKLRLYNHPVGDEWLHHTNYGGVPNEGFMQEGLSSFRSDGGMRQTVYDTFGGPRTVTSNSLGNMERRAVLTRANNRFIQREIGKPVSLERHSEPVKIKWSFFKGELSTSEYGILSEGAGFHNVMRPFAQNKIDNFSTLRSALSFPEQLFRDTLYPELTGLDTRANSRPGMD